MRKLFAVVCVLGFLASAVQAQGYHPAVANQVGGDDNITIVYDPGPGSLRISHPAQDNAAAAITTLEIVSSGAFFTPGAKPPALGGLFDVWSPTKAFKLDPAGFTSIDLGAGTAGLSAETLSGMLTVNGSFAGGGALTGVNLYAVPEPSSLVLLGIGGLCLLRRRK